MLCVDCQKKKILKIVCVLVRKQVPNRFLVLKTTRKLFLRANSQNFEKHKTEVCLENTPSLIQCVLKSVCIQAVCPLEQE